VGSESSWNDSESTMLVVCSGGQRHPFEEEPASVATNGSTGIGAYRSFPDQHSAGANGARVSKPKKRIKKIEFILSQARKGPQDVRAPLEKELATTPGSTEGGTTSHKSLLQLRPAVCVGIERSDPNQMS
jgi:hypothetical protein